ncbi:MAG: hypothetical protein ACK4V6_10340 [Microthrixaceae bacterium]
MHVEVFRQMASVGTSILEDLDAYPRTNRRTPTTPSIPKSPDSSLVTNFPAWATAQESSPNETDFVGSFIVPGGTTVTTPHLAVTARGYLKWGRPSSSQRASVQVSDLGGWALDLAQMWAQDFVPSSEIPHPASYTQTKDWFKARLGVRTAPSAGGSFNFDDLVGDIDGYLIGSLAHDNPTRPLDDVVREVRSNISQSPKWRFSAFFAQRFGSSRSVAKEAAVDVFNSGNFLVGGAVRYTLGGFSFAIASSLGGGTGLEPTSAERDAVSDVWADLVVALASGGPSAAPAP